MRDGYAVTERSVLTRAAVIRAAATLIATIASFLTVYALCIWAGGQTGPAIASAVFALSFGRRPAAHGVRRVAVSIVMIAFIALVAAGVGTLLLRIPPVGAAVFVAGMFASVYARNFEGIARRAGTIIALPLVAMLVVPAAPAHARGGIAVDIALAASAGIIALVYASVMHGIVARVTAHKPQPENLPRARPERTGMTATTRMAWQMAVALSAAFVAGFILFPAHWGWTVLTAFIVCSGARGRGDATYKAVLRLAGALGGTIVAAIAAHIWAPAGIAEAATIFGLLFVALLLREMNYAFWAACTTLILALLGRTSDGFNLTLLGTRLEAILAGAVCAVIAAWFVFPIRTEDVVRRYLADALKALDDVVVNAHIQEDRPHHIAGYDARMNSLEAVAPPVSWHRRIFVRRESPEHPARWIELAREIRRHAATIAAGDVAADRQRGRLRRAIGISRRAIRDHKTPDAPDRVTIGVALVDLRDTLQTMSAGIPKAG